MNIYVARAMIKLRCGIHLSLSSEVLELQMSEWEVGKGRDDQRELVRDIPSILADCRAKWSNVPRFILQAHVR